MALEFTGHSPSAVEQLPSLQKNENVDTDAEASVSRRRPGIFQRPLSWASPRLGPTKHSEIIGRLSEKTSTTEGEHQNWGEGASGRRDQRGGWARARRCQGGRGQRRLGKLRKKGRRGKGWGWRTSNQLQYIRRISLKCLAFRNSALGGLVVRPFTRTDSSSLIILIYQFRK